MDKIELELSLFFIIINIQITIMSKYEIPSAAPTPTDVNIQEQFIFEVAEDLLLQKDQIITQLQEELIELKEYILEQRIQRVNRDKLIDSLTSVVNDIIRLYPTFHEIPDLEGNNKRRKILALVKGVENVHNIVDYIDKFKNNAIILQALHEILFGITFENPTYQENGQKILCIAQSHSSILGFRFFNHGVLTDSANGHDYEFGYLKCQMDEIILRTIGVGFYGRQASANVTCSDNIKYKSKQEHFKIWEHKKRFSKRMVDAISEYVQILLRRT